MKSVKIGIIQTYPHSVSQIHKAVKSQTYYDEL